MDGDLIWKSTHNTGDRWRVLELGPWFRIIMLTSVTPIQFNLKKKIIVIIQKRNNEDKGQREQIHWVFKNIGNQMNNGNEEKVEKESNIYVFGDNYIIDQDGKLQKQNRFAGCGRGI